MNVLLFLIIVLIFIVGIGLLNERDFKLQSDIALILFSLIISLVLLFLRKYSGIDSLNNFIDRLGDFGFEEYLMDGVLCFMLFAGASKVNMNKFRQNIRPISLLALLTTVISSVFYGVLFWILSPAFCLVVWFLPPTLLLQRVFLIRLDFPKMCARLLKTSPSLMTVPV